MARSFASTPMLTAHDGARHRDRGRQINSRDIIYVTPHRTVAALALSFDFGSTENKQIQATVESRSTAVTAPRPLREDPTSDVLVTLRRRDASPDQKLLNRATNPSPVDPWLGHNTSMHARLESGSTRLVYISLT